jgi:predicted DNA-binding transcriptional regulator AlpA
MRTNVAPAEPLPLDRVLTIPEVCQVLGCSRSNFHRRIAATIAVTRISNGRAGVRASELARWLDARTIRPAVEAGEDAVAVTERRREAQRRSIARARAARGRA